MAEGKESLLDALVGVGPSRWPGSGQHLSEFRGAPPTVGPVEDVVYRFAIEEAEGQGLVDCAVQGVEGKDFGEVEQGAGHGRARDGLARGDVPLQEGGARVGPKARSLLPGPPGRSDLGPRG